MKISGLNKLLWVVLVILFVQCGQANKEQGNKAQATQVKKNIPKGVVNAKIVCQNDTSLSYAVYLPSGYNAANKYPVIFYFDAHARGKLPVNKYKPLAEKYGYVLIGSNNSKNELDFNTITNIFQVLINEVTSSLSIDRNRIYVSGFSGGAKVSGILCAMNSVIKGDIGCAAAFPLTKETTERSFDYIGFAGNEDFNMNDMRQLDRSLNETSIKHKLVIFDGKHDWAPANVIEEAFKWLETPETVANNSVSPDESSKEIKEQDMMGYYGNNIDKQNINWWKTEVGKLNKEINSGGDKETALRDKRVLNYTSLITFMHLSKILNTDELGKLENYLELYKLVDPTNPETAYLYATLYMRQNKPDRAIKSLSEAVKLGFDDLERLQKDATFNSLKGKKEYSDIIEGVKNNENTKL